MEKQDLWIKCGGTSLGVVDLTQCKNGDAICSAILEALLDLISESSEHELSVVEGGPVHMLVTAGEEEPQ